jgi:choloylglycine hydrolase
MKNIVLKSLYIIISFLTLTHKENLQACTGIKLIAKDGSLVHGRTLEFGRKIDTSTVVVPRNYFFVGTTPNGKGLSYTTKYGFVGTITFNDLAAMDGMNEKGLAVGTFYFPGYAEYTAITSENQSMALSPIEFPNWILSLFSTVDEVKAALNQVVIAPTLIKAWGPIPPPFHYIVYDKFGSSLVIEPVNGKLVVYDNKIGVLTNSPNFEWHMTNLRNFINLRAFNAPTLKINDLMLSPFGQGSGMVGLPGDFTPPSRFVRATIFSITAVPSENAEKAILQVFHILNQFDIPVGVAREIEQGVIYSDYTMITCARDPQSLKYYYKTYEDQNIKMIDLKKFNLNATSIKHASTADSQSIQDISLEFEPR